jgi:hypothetical protein
MLSKPEFRRVSRGEFEAASEGLRKETNFPKTGPEWRYKAGRHWGYENLTTGEFVILRWNDER